MKIETIGVEVVRSRNFQTVKYNSTITIEEGDNINAVRNDETVNLNKRCLAALKAFEELEKRAMVVAVKDKIKLV